MSNINKTHYHSGISMLLFLVKYSKPDLANTIRELSKMMMNPILYASKELKRVIKYIFDTKSFRLKLELIPMNPEKQFEVKLFSNSDWAGDKESRTSVTGFCVFFLQGCAMSWKSKKQNIICLSSSEAKLIALSEAIKKIRFIYEVLTSIKIVVKTPIVCHIDNVGTIFIAENGQATPKSKYMNIKAKFVIQFVVNKFIKVIFVKSEDNFSDIFIKNIQSKILDKHNGKFL